MNAPEDKLPGQGQCERLKTIQEQWRMYRDMCYPGYPLPADQNRQLHQSFYAGAWIMFQSMEALADLPEGLAKVTLQALRLEVEAMVKQHTLS